MACNKYKNCHYKSTVQRYNNVSQTVLITNTITNPVTLALGSTVTDTGVAIDTSTNADTIENTGTYRIAGNLNITGVTSGDLTVGITINGVVANETLKTVTVAVGELVVVPVETVRLLKTCCNMENYNIGFIVYGDGTGAGVVNNISSNIVKLA